MQECNYEMKYMKELKVYRLVETPKLRKKIDTRWVLKVKEDEVVNITKFKARWSFNGYMQFLGVNYYLTHSPVSRMSTLRVVLSLAVMIKFHIHRMDVSNAFVNYVLNDTVYINPSSWYDNFLPAVRKLAQFVCCVLKIHWEALKGVLIYVKDTKKIGLFYKVDVCNDSIHE